MTLHFERYYKKTTPIDGTSGRKKRKQKFNPKRPQIQAAVDEFLRSGGKITKIETVEFSCMSDWEDSLDPFDDNPFHPMYVPEWL
jgi:hypothetical protein